MVDITIHNKYREILDTLVDYLYIGGIPLKIIRVKYLRLVINSKILVNDLIRYGCVQAKTFKLKFPIISEKYYRDFIRGYFDGDGSIVNNNGTLNLTIIGTIDLLNSIQNILIENCNVPNNKYDNRNPERDNNIRSLRYGGNILFITTYMIIQVLHYQEKK